MIKHSELVTRVATLYCDKCNSSMKYVGATDDTGSQPLQFIHLCFNCQTEVLMPDVYPLVTYVPRETFEKQQKEENDGT